VSRDVCSSYLFPEMGSFWGSAPPPGRSRASRIDNEYACCNQRASSRPQRPRAVRGFLDALRSDIGLMRRCITGRSACGGMGAVEPEEGRFDEEAIRHYWRIVRSGGEGRHHAVVDLHHHSNPLWVCRDGGWMNPRVVQRLQRFARRMVEARGTWSGLVDRLNEPDIWGGGGVLHRRACLRTRGARGVLRGVSEPARASARGCTDARGTSTRATAGGWPEASPSASPTQAHASESVRSAEPPRRIASKWFSAR